MIQKLIRKELKKRDFRVSIFGSARIKKGDKIYKQIKTLAKMLGERGIDIVTGGGPGLMMAANSGHKTGRKKFKSKNGKRVHSIGLSIILPKEQKSNKNLDIEKRFIRFSGRLDNFMLLSSAVVVAPGGVGTMLEFFYTWQLAQVKHICNIPIILIGKQWKGLVRWLEKEPLKNKYFNKEDLDLLFVVDNYKEAIKIIERVYEEFQKGKKADKNFCINYKKYKF